MTRLGADTLLGTDAWSREARRVRAARLGLALDEAELALHDVRDLQALHASLHGVRAGHTGARRAALQGLRTWVRGTAAAAGLARR